MTKVWRSEKFWWDFLTCHLEQIVLRGLNSPASFWLLSFSFVNIDNKWADCSYLNGIEWQKSEKFWWDFLTCHLEQIALRGLNSPAYFWLLSFLFINNDTNERIASKWDIFFLKFFAAFSETRANRSTNFCYFFSDNCPKMIFLANRWRGAVSRR